ncbi:MAG: hypothetical protein WAM11_06870 [Cyanobium sp.]
MQRQPDRFTLIGQFTESSLRTSLNEPTKSCRQLQINLKRQQQGNRDNTENQQENLNANEFSLFPASLSSLDPQSAPKVKLPQRSEQGWLPVPRKTAVSH